MLDLADDEVKRVPISSEVKVLRMFTFTRTYLFPTMDTELQQAVAVAFDLDRSFYIRIYSALVRTYSAMLSLNLFRSSVVGRNLSSTYYKPWKQKILRCRAIVFDDMYWRDHQTWSERKSRPSSRGRGQVTVMST